MIKLSKNGFVLVETLVVTIFIAILFIVVYQNTVSTIGEYEKMANYDDIDSLYVANLFKQNLIRYGNFDYINTTLGSKKYIDISDCNNTSIYTNSNYCTKLKRNMSISNDDYIILTTYNIKEFRNIVNNNDFFDSGKFSNFRNYIATLTDIDKYYKENKKNYDREYRIFIIRSATNSDNSTTVKYANLGIFIEDEEKIITQRLNEKIVLDNTLITAEPNFKSPTSDISGLYVSYETKSNKPTYYFRGNVENNYVVFGGYFWRIIRINEDGTIRMILASNIGKYAVHSSIFGENNVSSTAYGEIMGWFHTNILDSEKEKVASNYFCAGNNTDINFNCNNYLNKNVGMITKNEVIFAGGSDSYSNMDYYLYDGHSVLTMTPDGSGNFWLIDIDGSLQLIDYYTSAIIRPVINLKADVIATGTGTTTDPYIIR